MDVSTAASISAGHSPTQSQHYGMTNPTTNASAAAVPIAFCITELEPGGAERALVELVTRLNREEFAPVVYSLGPQPAGDRDVLVRRLESAGVPVHFLSASNLQFPRALIRLRGLLKIQQPQIIQCFLFHANVVGTLAAQLAGVQHVLTGIRVAERRRWHLTLQRWISPLVDQHVCVSESVARHAHEEGGIPLDKLLVHTNGIDLSQFASLPPVDPTELGLPPGRSLITFAGRLDEQKGVDWLLELSPQILARSPGHDLLVLGDGPLMGRLTQRAGELNVQSRVHFAGWRPDIRPFLAASHVVVIPSRWEGMPNVLLEAMAAGLPVVATDVEGVDEVLGDAAEGQLVSAGDSRLLVERISKICSNHQLHNQLGSFNRRRIEQDFSLDRAVKQYQTTYHTLLRRG